MQSHEYRSRDGAEFRHYESRYTPCGPDEALVIIRENTARVRAEAALREAQIERGLLLARLLEIQEEERAHLARELHDQVGQQLTSVLLALRIAESIGDVESAAQHIAEARAETGSALENVRQLAFDMRPSSLEDLGLTPALRQELADIGARAGFTGVLHAPNPQLLDTLLQSARVTEIGLYRVIQAALTNIVRHANATNVNVTIRPSPDSIAVVIDDDGIGFSVDEVLAGPVRARFGLLAMEERVRAFGGSMTVESTPGEGTTTFIEAPVPDPSETREQSGSLGAVIAADGG